MKIAWAAAAALLCMGGAAIAQTAAPAAKPPMAAPGAAKAAPAKPAVKKVVKPAAPVVPAPVEAAAAPVILEPLANSVQAYAAFQADIDEVNAGSIQNAKDIERALDKAAALNRDQLTRGFIAYGALTAARNDQFVQEIRKTAGFYGKERIVKALMMNQNYAGTMAGGDKATENVVRASAADADRVIAASEALKQRAREAQNLAWGKALSGKSAARVSRLRTAAAGYTAKPLAPEMSARLKVVPGDPNADAISLGGLNFWRAFTNKNGDVATLTAMPTQVKAFTWTSNSGGAGIRGAMLSLAALYALDATMDQPVDELLNNKTTNTCLQGAQLTLYQCVASAHFNYENMACVGEAGLGTVGTCFQDASK
jgi:hypothetical protein